MSAEFKGTPGPWHWSDKFQTEDGRYTWTLLGGESGYGILSCDGEGNSPQGINDETNARLIATAPDLLDGLKFLYTAYVRCLEAGMDRITSLGGSCDSVERMEQDDPALIQTRRLIAKATGESP